MKSLFAVLIVAAALVVGACNTTPAGSGAPSTKPVVSPVTSPATSPATSPDTGASASPS